MLQSVGTNVPKSSERQARCVGNLSLGADPSALLRDRFLTELAYYEADTPYLTTEKCAQRCRWLSQLLTAAVAVDNASDPTLR